MLIILEVRRFLGGLLLQRDRVRSRIHDDVSVSFGFMFLRDLPVGRLSSWLGSDVRRNCERMDRGNWTRNQCWHLRMGNNITANNNKFAIAAAGTLSGNG